MERKFKDVIEEIKSITLDRDETKKYILAIKRVLQGLYEGCKGEQEESEILQTFLEEYNEDLRFRGAAQQLVSNTLKHSAFKRLLQDARGNKANFSSLIREAKKIESENKSSDILLRKDLRDSTISAIRYIIRTKGLTKESDIIEAIQTEKAKVDRELRNSMISTIQSSVSMLAQYGFIDEYINDSNEELEQLGLSELRYIKRNPIPDEQYDEDGKIIKDAEDIGVLDTFSRENLEKMSIEDLLIMTTFWESKYFQERIELSKAMATIKTLDLWGDIIHKDDKAITDLDSKKVEGALRRDIALTYLCKDGAEITSKIRKQYKKFMESEGIVEDISLEDEVKAMRPDILNLAQAAIDIAMLECLIVHQLRTKDLKIKKWGVIDKEEIEQSDEQVETVTIGIDNKNFRGPLVMSVPRNILKEFLNEEEVELPSYDKKFDSTYSSIMSKLYLPNNTYFSNLVKRLYKENPNSELLADLAGKKVKGEER